MPVIPLQGAELAVVALVAVFAFPSRFPVKVDAITALLKRVDPFTIKELAVKSSVDTESLNVALLLKVYAPVIVSPDFNAY